MRILGLLTAGLVAVASTSLAGVSGRIVGPDGAPIAGAAIAAFLPETIEDRALRLTAGRARVPAATVTSGADGAFHVESSSALLTVEGSAPGFGPVASAVLRDGTATLQAPRAEVKRARVWSKARPVVSAIVVWIAEGQDGAWAERIVRSAGDGSYEVPDPHQWATSGFAFHPDFAPTDLDAAAFEKPDAVSHELAQGVTVEGSVRDENGQPLGGAAVWVGTWMRWPLARSAADGTFRIAHAPQSWQGVSVRHAGLAAAAYRRTGTVALVARPSRRIAGVVTDGAARPLAAARVTVMSEQGIGAAAVTDARGQYAIEGLVAGQYRAALARPGHRSEANRPSSDVIDLRTAPSARRDFVMPAVPMVNGRVRDASGRPVPGAIVAFGLKGTPHVYAPDPYEAQDGARVFTAADGTFSIALPESPGPRFEMFKDRPLIVLKVGHAAAHVEASELSAAPLQVTLGEGVELRGRVRGPDGTAVPGVRVLLAEDGAVAGSLMPSHVLIAAAKGDGWATSGPDGVFSVRVHPVVHHLAFRKTGFAPKVVRGHDARASEPLEVALDAAALVRGRVVRSDGRGVGEVEVSVSDAATQMPLESATTGADGGFEFSTLSPGAYRLDVQHFDLGIAESRIVEAPATDVRVVLAATGTLHGRVVDAVSRRPVPSFRVQVGRADEGSPSSTRFAEVEDSAGAFTMTDVAATSMTVSVTAEGYANGTVEDVAVLADGEVSVEIALDSETPIRGRVTDGSGPLAGASVAARADDQERSAGATTDSEGEYELRGLPAARVTLIARAQGFLAEKRALDSAQTPRADFALKRGLSLRGEVVRDGVGVPGATVGARSGVVNAGAVSAQADERGRFTLDGLVPGRYTVTAWHVESGKAVLEDVDVEAAGSLRLVLTAGQTAVLTGRVVGLAQGDQPMMAAVLASNEETGARAQALVDPSMSFRMTDAPAGRVKVIAYLATQAGETRASRPIELTLAAGAEAEAVLEFGSEVVRGVVTRDGGPVPHAVVSFRAGDRHGAGRTSAHGAYEVVGLEAGAYTVDVSGDDVSFTTEHVVTGSGQFDIDVTPSSIRGRAARADDGAPVAGVQVTLWRSGARENTPAAQVSTGVNGAFVLPSLQEGRYRLTTSKAGFGQEVHELDLVRGQVAEVELALAPAQGVSVTVVDARDGRPLEAIVVVRDASRRIVANRHSGTEEDGVLNIPLANGSYALSTSATGYGTATVPVTSPSEGLRVALTPGGTLVIESRRGAQGRVRLVKPDGEEYVQCWCNGIADIQITGRWTTVENVASGRYTLELVDVPETVSPQPIVIVEGQRTAVAID